jgi:hypothetical protein
MPLIKTDWHSECEKRDRRIEELVRALRGVTLIATCKVDPGCDEDIATVMSARALLAKLEGDA